MKIGGGRGAPMMVTAGHAHAHSQCQCQCECGGIQVAAAICSAQSQTARDDDEARRHSHRLTGNSPNIAHTPHTLAVGGGTSVSAGLGLLCPMLARMGEQHRSPAGGRGSNGGGAAASHAGGAGLLIGNRGTTPKKGIHLIECVLADASACHGGRLEGVVLAKLTDS